MSQGDYSLICNGAREVVCCLRFRELMPLDGAIQRKPSGPDPWLKYSGFRAGRVASSPLKQCGRHTSGMDSKQGRSQTAVAARAVGESTDWRHIPQSGKKGIGNERRSILRHQVLWISDR